MKIYWTYRPERIEQPQWLPDGRSLNGYYTPALYLNNQFADWNYAWLTNVIDSVIPEEAYTWEIAPWIKKLTRFIMCEYNETYVDPVELARSMSNVGARFDIHMLDVETSRQWVRDNTNLEEIETWKFKISNETTWMDWEVIPAKYLIID